MDIGVEGRCVNLNMLWKYKEKEYSTEMKFTATTLHISVTDKCTSEKWACDYDATYIETVTRKTGNFKRFDVFIKMLKDGFLNVKNSLSLDLVSYNQLFALKVKSDGAHCGTISSEQKDMNMRYIILTYRADYDIIYYPVPLKYCGLPHPEVLQKAIRSLESEVSRLREKLKEDRGKQEKIYKLEERVVDLSNENECLKKEVKQLKAIIQQSDEFKDLKTTSCLTAAVESLKENYVEDRIYFKESLRELIAINSQVVHQINQLKPSTYRDYERVKRTISPKLHNKTCSSGQFSNSRDQSSGNNSAKINYESQRGRCTHVSPTIRKAPSQKVLRRSSSSESNESRGKSKTTGVRRGSTTLIKGSHSENPHKGGRGLTILTKGSHSENPHKGGIKHENTTSEDPKNINFENIVARIEHILAKNVERK